MLSLIEPIVWRPKLYEVDGQTTELHIVRKSYDDYYRRCGLQLELIDINVEVDAIKSPILISPSGTY